MKTHHATPFFEFIPLIEMNARTMPRYNKGFLKNSSFICKKIFLFEKILLQKK
ncbi:hypothetical protein ABIE66_001001 [Peribacillus sp. B2I2]|uniref:hypothetical protein n=1 Tax=Peribacillus sp. B2I2 TaxID=3156468 RepID=UPI0035161DE3